MSSGMRLNSHNRLGTHRAFSAEILGSGRVSGNTTASDRVDIRNEGSVTGDMTAQRIIIGDGAFFKGGMDISKPGRQNDSIVGAKISASGSQTAA